MGLRGWSPAAVIGVAGWVRNGGRAEVPGGADPAGARRAIGPGKRNGAGRAADACAVRCWPPW
ncbi:hypothetical protein E4K10_22480 [Streptomyces sp. T1317-0309]|nr:hypothetical protein E4K10_22480 [Streptomyces sp. T1317-0309]